MTREQAPGTIKRASETGAGNVIALRRPTLGATSSVQPAAAAEPTTPAPLVWGSAAAPEMSRRLETPPRYRQLDRHRGIAVLGAIVFTVFQFCDVGNGLYAGTPAHAALAALSAAVPWFFVLTGFLAFEPVVRWMLDDGPEPSMRNLLVSRAVRFLPVYYVSVAVVWFCRQQGLPGDWHDLIEHLSFTQVFDEKRIYYTNGPAWAVAVAVYLYLAVALVGQALRATAARVQSRSERIALLAGSAGLLAVVSLVYKTWAFGLARRSTAAFATTWFGPVASLDTFAIGMAAAVVVVAVGERRLRLAGVRLGLRGAAVLVVAAAVALRAHSGWSAVYFSTECALGFGCLLVASVARADVRPPPGTGWQQPLGWIGASSYSIYLWHEPVLLALHAGPMAVVQGPASFGRDLVIVVVAAVAVGRLSYRLVERPAAMLAGFFRDGRFQRESARR